MNNADLIVVCGATASGKSSLALQLAGLLNGEIISADSMQIYKEMNIGTAKPTIGERRQIPHHMLDIVSVCGEYNVSDYVTDAKECIDGVISRGKIPVIAGGTGLYIDSLINNTDFFEIENDFEYRKELAALAEKCGKEAVYEQLKAVDPQCAAKLHYNDLKRVIRALEVYKVTGKTMTLIQRESIRQRRYTPVFIGLDFSDRNALYTRIEQRVDQMMSDGWLDEAVSLKNPNLSRTASAAIGYSQLFRCIDGEMSLECAVDDIKKKTRNYAKRQLTWFRKNKEINWVYPDSHPENTDYPLAAAVEILNAGGHI